MEFNIHIRIVNGTTTNLGGLNLYAIVEALEEGQEDVVDIDAGANFELKGFMPMPEYLRRNFDAAITGVGGVPGYEGQEDVVYYEIIVEGEG
jgi:hypothetical protein